MTDLRSLSATAAIGHIERGDCSSDEIYEAYRSAALSEELNAFVYVAEETPALNDGPLRGLPLGVKDLFCLEGVPSQTGSVMLEEYCPPYTASVVEDLLGAGARFLGKTNQDEFAMGSSTENSAFGPTLNPWSTDRVPGGSSGGSAAAVAAGLVPWALGTDTGGSIRQPAALCGIVGFKPTYGSISRYGMIAFASSLDQAGVFTKTTEDAALLYSHMTKRDVRDATSCGHPDAIISPTLQSLQGVRLGVPTELLQEGIDDGVRARFEDSLNEAAKLGATIVECSLPHTKYALAAYYVLAPAEASSNLARFTGVRYGLRVDGDGTLDGMMTATREAGFGDEVKRRILIGTYVLSSGYYDAYYGQAQKVRTLVVEDFENVFRSVDAIVTPTSPTVAFKLGATTDPMTMYRNDVCTIPASLAGLPGISIPNGMATDDGVDLPTGLQLIGPAWSDNRLLNYAHALETAFAFRGLV